VTPVGDESQARRASILVIDDRVENLRALKAVLEPLECNLVTATSGREALKCLLREQFAVILLDVQMPDMDGFETASLIRDRRRTRQIPIIFVSATSTSSEHVFRGYEAGAVDYIVKPIDPVAIRSKVRVFIELHERGEEIRRQAEILRERELERVRRDAERRRHRRATMLDSIAAALERRTDIAGRADQLVRSCVERFADFALVEIAGEGISASAALASSRPEEADELRELLRPPIAPRPRDEPHQRIRAERQLTRDAWLALVPGMLGERAWDQLSPTAALVVPLRLEGRRLGRLTLARSRGAGPYDVEEVELVAELAKRAAMAIENSRLYELERERSRMLQLSLLDLAPLAHPALAAATRYIAGSADLEVGGDWLDLVERDDGSVVVIVGDVVGRGIPAATAMGKLRSAIGALAHVTDDPATMLERLDRFATGVAGAELATVVCAVVAPDARTLAYSSAGHLPGLLVSGHENAAFLEDGRGFPLGIYPSVPRTQGLKRLGAGSMLLFFTDGLVDTPGLPLSTGLDRLRALAKASADDDPEFVCDELIEKLVNELRDDVALVCLRLAGNGADFHKLRFPAEPQQLALARKAFGGWLREREIDETVVGELVVAFDEACSNAVRHAYRDGEGTVSVRLTHESGVLTVRVSDTGRWSEPRIAQDDGRGLEIIRALVDRSGVHGTPYGTTIVMQKQVAAAPDRCAGRNGRGKTATRLG
jgi:CheY-like chemotaxis protein/serine phosphatase RsbU (regulator of sigma subunit)/anti-sigma regulatory factor (Ser/Thr protein kinase)